MSTPPTLPPGGGIHGEPWNRPVASLQSGRCEAHAACLHLLPGPPAPASLGFHLARPHVGADAFAVPPPHTLPHARQCRAHPPSRSDRDRPTGCGPSSARRRNVWRRWSSPSQRLLDPFAVSQARPTAHTPRHPIPDDRTMPQRIAGHTRNSLSGATRGSPVRESGASKPDDISARAASASARTACKRAAEPGHPCP